MVRPLELTRCCKKADMFTAQNRIREKQIRMQVSPSLQVLDTEQEYRTMEYEKLIDRRAIGDPGDSGFYSATLTSS